MCSTHAQSVTTLACWDGDKNDVMNINMDMRTLYVVLMDRYMCFFINQQEICKKLHAAIDKIDEARYDAEAKVQKTDKEVRDKRQDIDRKTEREISTKIFKCMDMKRCFLFIKLNLFTISGSTFHSSYQVITGLIRFFSRFVWFHLDRV